MAESWDDETTATGVEIPELAPEEAHRKRPCVTVLTGVAGGQLYHLGRGEAVLGRAPDATIRIVDDGVSRHHARLRVETGKVWLEDLTSRNGTFLNGRRVDQTIPLHDGDKIQIGRTTVLRFAYHDELDESFHETLVSSALRDPLTRLFNKRYFLDRLERELMFARRHDTALSLLLVDLDHFKRVNDTHGHLAGDAVLANLASVLVRGVRNEDVVARFGGEEMAIILRAVALEPALVLADRLRRLIEQTVTLYGARELRATASIGAAEYFSSGAETVEDLIDAADRALYRAKGAGRNRVSRLTLV